MKEQDQPDNIDHPENISPCDNSPADDVPDHARKASRSSSDQEKRAPALSQRLAEAFREGVATARPDHEKRPEVRIPPPIQTYTQTHTQKERQQSGDARALDRVIQEGGSAASVLYDKAAGALDSAVRLARTAPAISTRWVEAFREGFTSVRPREVKAKEDRTPYSADRRQSGDRGIMDRIFQVGGSAAEVVRGAAASVQPGAARGAERKIRVAEKRIKDLYVEIGQDAVVSWSKGGPVETEKLDELLDEVRRNEEEIRNLRECVAETVAARKAKPVKSQQAAKEAASAPAVVKEDTSFDVSVSGAKVDEQIENLGNWQQPESPEGGDFAVTETSIPSAPEAEFSASPPVQEQPVDAEAVQEQAVEAEAVPQEKVSDEADQALPEEPVASQEKIEDTEVFKK